MECAYIRADDGVGVHGLMWVVEFDEGKMALTLCFCFNTTLGIC